MQTTTRSQLNEREDRWEKSFRAERQGDYAKALEIHKGLLAEDVSSYAACIRAGWLCYRLKAYEAAICHYECARAIRDDEWPERGIMNCLDALGDVEKGARLAKSLNRTGNRVVLSAAM